jgi:hypothetical protein
MTGGMISNLTQEWMIGNPARKLSGLNPRKVLDRRASINAPTAGDILLLISLIKDDRFANGMNGVQLAKRRRCVPA